MNLSLTFEILYLWKMLQKWSQIYFQKIHHAPKWLLFSLSIIFGSIVCPVCGESTDCTFHYIYIYIYICIYIYILYIIYLILYIWYIYILLFFFLYYSSQNLIPCEVFTAHSKPGKENVNLAQQVNHDCCKQVIDTSTSQSYQTQQLYNIFHKLNCKSKLSFT